MDSKVFGNYGIMDEVFIISEPQYPMLQGLGKGKTRQKHVLSCVTVPGM